MRSSLADNFLSKVIQRLHSAYRNRVQRTINHRIASIAERKNIVLVQIGSNDGRTNDPFYNYIVNNRWKALLVEPVPYLFERLQQTHRDSENVILENCGISSENGTKEFYYLRNDPSGASPWWHDQIGSFSRDQVLKERSRIPGFDKLLTSINVPCFTLTSLLEKHHIGEIDILHTDVEGYDWKVVRQLDFSRWTPAIILFEHKHLEQVDRISAKRVLKTRGYRLLVGVNDTLAYAVEQLEPCA